MSQAKNEKRKAERFDYPGRIEYVLDAIASTIILKGVIVNISETGLSIYAFSPLFEGQKIIILSSLPVNNRSAIICWMKQEDESMYKMGLKFVNRVIRFGEKTGQA